MLKIDYITKDKPWSNTLSCGFGFNVNIYLIYLIIYSGVVTVSDESLVEFSGVVKSFKSQQDEDRKGVERNVIFSELDLSIARGRTTALIGPSGSGKTTLLRLINRLESADGGRITFAGKDVESLEVLSLRRLALLLPQKPLLFEGTVRENITYGSRFSGGSAKGDDGERFGELLAVVGLPEELLERKGDLSGGEEQRVCLARALWLSPQLLMLDESTSYLDPPVARKVLANLAELQRETGLTVIHVTHEIPKLKLAHRIIFLADGGVVQEGDGKSLLTNPRTAQMRDFLGELK